ncbi:MAG: FAD-dependent oxidoreductase [Spirochaetota bacterium]
MKTYDAIVIGAGSVGLPLSWNLAARGLKVAVIDQEASWGRGQNRAAIGGIRATHSDPAKIRIGLESIRIFSTMKERHGLDLEWRRGGYLYVAYDEGTRLSLSSLIKAQKEAGLDIDWIGPDMILGLAPGIKAEGLLGGTYSPGDGFASPLRAATAFHRLGMEAGVEFFFGLRVEGFSVKGRRIGSLEAGGETWSAGLYVNAAGAEASDLASLAGIEAAVFPDCHEAGVTEPVERFMEPMVVDIRSEAESGNYYFYQAETGQVVFCITPRPQIWGRDKDSTSSFLPLSLKRILELYPRLRNLRVRRTWRGMYPMTPDGLPILGYPAGAENLLLAVGMCGQGFMLGPGLGEILAQTIVSGGCASRPEGSTGYGSIFRDLAWNRAFEHGEFLK